MSEVVGHFSTESLGNLASLRRGITYSASMLVERDSGIPYVNMKTFSKGGGFNKQGIKFYAGPFLPDDLAKEIDLLVVNTDVTPGGDIVGIPVYLPDEYRINPFLFSHHVTRLRLENRIEPEYLYYLLCTGEYRSWMHRYARGTTVLMLDMSGIKRIPVKYHSDKIVRYKVVSVLNVIDQTIEKTEALIEKYQQIKAGLMHDLFTRGIGADGKLRPPREQAPELYQETPIGWIPKEWRLTKLEAVSDIIDPQPDHRTPPEQLDGAPYIGIGDFDLFGEVDFQKCRKVIPAAFQKQRHRFTAKRGDIIFGKIGTIGKPKTLDDGDYALSANVVLIQPNLNPSYMRHSLDSWIFMKQVSDITNTTSQPALGIEKIRVIKIPMPMGQDEIEMVAQKLNALDGRLRSEGHDLEKLKKQKTGLMHDLLTGKKQVNVDQPEAAHV